MNLNSRLLQLFKESKATFLSRKQIFQLADAHTRFEKDAVGEALDVMVKEGLLYFDKRNARYRLSRQEDFVTGIIDGNARGFAFLVPDGSEGKDMFIAPHRLNGALHRDRVLARPIPDTADEAEVVKVISRGMKQLVGTYTVSNGARFVIADDKKFFKDVFIPPRKSLNARNGDKVVAEITVYPHDGRLNPEGEVTKVLGVGGVNSDMVSVALSFGISDQHSEETERHCRKVKQPVSGQMYEDREDFRNCNVFTIDGEDAKDLDDAVSVRVLADGKVELGVHIADVSHYVRPEDPVDKEAFQRGTSVYFPDRVFAMLPKTLSNGVCSLQEGEDRLTLSCVMVFKEDEIVDFRLTPSVINSKHRMTYNKVQAILDGDEESYAGYSDIAEDIKIMARLAQKLIDRRNVAGNIDFDSNEVGFEIVDDDVTAVVPKKRLFAHRIIEQFMISANETVAQFVFNCGYPMVYRIHEKPDGEKLAVLIQLLKALGINIQETQNMHASSLQKALEQARQTPYGNMISDVMLRTMQKARYSVVNAGHFGLSSRCYCHFTSPIRRYPDLVVHRVVKSILCNKMTDKAVSAYEEMTERCAVQSSIREKVAMEAERKADDMLKCRYCLRLVGQCFDGRISGVTENGLFVELPDTVEGFIERNDLVEDDLTFDGSSYSLYNDNVRYRLGDEIRIKVLSVNMSACKIYFAPVYGTDEQNRPSRF